jgi:hypothetical protein
MPEFSTEFWVGTAIAVITLLIGLGVTLAMDAKTKGEFRVAVVSFLVSSLTVAYGIVGWDMKTDLSTLPRRLVAYGLLAVTLLITGETIRWARSRHQRAALNEVSSSEPSRSSSSESPQVSAPNQSKANLDVKPEEAAPAKAPSGLGNERTPPYSRTESFIVDIPYYSANDGFPLPTAALSNDGYPLAEAYSCIGGVVSLYAPPDAKQITQIAGLDTVDERAEALVQALRACIISDIITAERGSSKFGVSATKGSVADYKPAIVPPRSSDYPTEKLIATLGSLPFGKNEHFLFLYKHRPMPVPEGSEVGLGTAKLGKNDWVIHSVFTIANPHMFSLAFGVAPINAALGVIPGSFPEKYKTQQSQYTTYSLAVTMKIEIQRSTMSTSEVEDFIHWADGLWACIRDKYDIKRSS